MPKLKFVIYAAGIGLSYWYFGIVQEKITRSQHQPGNEKFTCTMTLVLLQCIFNTIFAKFLLATFLKHQGSDRTRSSYFAISSLTYLTAMVSSNMALQYVNYPTQVVGKSCKPIPIMILGVILGVALFMYKKDIFDIHQQTASTSSALSLSSMLGLGEMLLLLSLTMDGLTGAVQERMKTEYRTKSGHMMYKINLWSTFYLIASTLFTGELIKFYHFIGRHPNLVYDITLFSSLSAIGQLFIFLTVAEFGPLPCSIVTTTRKFFTVLTSVFLYGNKMTTSQWIGSSLVFFGLTLDAIYGKSGDPIKVKKN